MKELTRDERLTPAHSEIHSRIESGGLTRPWDSRTLLREAGLTGYVDVFDPAVPAAIFAAVIGERNRRCKEIAGALAAAFGGRSQYDPCDLGRAVAGQIRNNGLGCYGTAEELVACVYDATLFEGDGHYPAEEPDYDLWMPEAVAACHESGFDSRTGHTLPYRHYVPPVGTKGGTDHDD